MKTNKKFYQINLIFLIEFLIQFNSNILVLVMKIIYLTNLDQKSKKITLI